jgi:predicted Zn-dependent protease
MRLFIAFLLLVASLPARPQEAPGIPARTYRALQEINGLLEGERYAQARRRLDELAAEVRGRGLETALVDRSRGYLCLGEGNEECAVEAFARAVDSGHLPFEVSHGLIYTLAQLWLRLDNLDGAAYAIGKWMLWEDSPGAEAHLLAAQIAHRRGRLAEAIGHMRRAVRLRERPPVPWLEYLLSLYLQDKDHGAALPVLRRLIRRSPDRYAYWRGLADLYRALGKPSHALAAWVLADLQGILEDRHLPALARLYLYLKQPWPAARLLAGALEKGRVPSTPDHWRLLADAWLLAREPDRALRAQRRVIALGGGGRDRIRLAQMHAQREEWRPVAELLEAMPTEGKDRITARGTLLLAVALHHLGRREQAIAHLRQVAGDDSPVGDEARRWLEYLSG